MSTQQTSIPVSLPGDLDSPRAKLVYLYLETVGEATAGRLAEELDMQRMTAYSILGTLASRGVVDRDGDRFAVTP
jgi:DNA-binding IclR family transcriptional regulator